MSIKNSELSDKIDHLFRYEYGKLVSVLTKTFGTNNIELAEDVVQDAMLEAVKQWSNGVPENPIGWIYRVAKNKAVNIVNREKHKRVYESEVAQYLQSAWTVEPALKHIFTDKEIADDQLRMMFTCCHPSVSSDSQVALTLKTLCGFGIPEIAHAFLTTEENINKRLVRARKNIREAHLSFEVPVGKELEERLLSVLETIYLLFNEGYNSTSGNELIKYDLCEEAIRLAEIIATNQNIKNKSTVSALLALMLLNTSRFKSRVDENNTIVDLKSQDRSKWDQDLIKKGLYYLGFSTQQNEVSIYHILAAISANYCTSRDFDSIDWEAILTLYDHLIEIDSSPIVHLNRAIIISKTEGAKKALQVISNMEGRSTLESYLPYYTAKSELHFQNNEIDLTIKTLNQALKISKEKKFNTLINSKLEEYRKKY